MELSHNYDIYADKIFYIRNVLPEHKEIINLVELTDSHLTDSDAIEKWKDWKASDIADNSYGRTKATHPELFATSSSEVKTIITSIYDALIHSLDQYQKVFMTNIGKHTSVNISKYLNGKGMNSHADVDETKTKNIPTVSAVMYLNDDYEGGDLYFEHQDVQIKPDAGSVIIFPSIRPYYHASLPVTGTKYIVPIFCYMPAT